MGTCAIKKRYPLHDAICKNKRITGELLIYINTKDINGLTPLHYTMIFGSDKGLVVWLVEKGAYIDQIDYFGNTILHYAVLHDIKEDVLKYLLCKNINHNILVRNRSGLSPLNLILKHRKYDILKILLHKRNTIKNVSILNYAMKHKSPKDVIELLISSGAKIDDKDVHGNNPIHHAVKSNYYDIIPTLINSGLSINMGNFDGNTPIHLACSEPQSITDIIKHIKLLVDDGADINSQNLRGETPLHLICRYELSYHMCCNVLLCLGADPNIMNIDNITPMDILMNLILIYNDHHYNDPGHYKIKCLMEMLKLYVHHNGNLKLFYDNQPTPFANFIITDSLRYTPKLFTFIDKIITNPKNHNHKYLRQWNLLTSD